MNAGQRDDNRLGARLNCTFVIFEKTSGAVHARAARITPPFGPS